jgi:N-acetyl sugar amidotransferase
MTRAYQICTRCVMDTTDPDIQFDENGVCNHCHEYDLRISKKVFTGAEGKRRLDQFVTDIKRDGKNKDYDCVIGVSGGVDSTYVAYKVKELGLRPLAVHLDNGWDSELAVKNIENALKKLNIDLHTYVLDWEEFKDLQVAFLKASTPDSEIPSDHAIFASMCQTAEKIGTKYILMGYNTRTETHLPSAWSQGHLDWKYIKSVHQQFSVTELKTFPHLNLWTYFRYRSTQKWINILDYLDYIKEDAMDLLQQELGWKYYGGKHYESIYTRFYQGYILPKKFGYDKRKTHLSSLVCSGEMSREEALAELKKEPYPCELQEEDKTYVIKKLSLTDEEFENIMNLPKKTYGDYPSSFKFYKSPIYKGIVTVYRSLK